MSTTIQGDTAKSTQSSHKFNAVTGKANPNYKAPSSSSSSKSSSKDTIKALQRALNAKGANLKVDGINGPLTKAAAAKYGGSSSSSSSQSNSVNPFGIETITKTLSKGSNSTQVKELQKYLAANGYKGSDGKPLKVDGTYGPQTKTAVMEFQSKNGLKVDGIFGPKSLAKTKIISSTGVQEGIGKPSDDPSYEFNQETGDPNPKYNPNINTDKGFNTGDPTQDALLKELQDYIKTQQDAGLKINEKLNFDQNTLNKFLETAKKQVHPYYAQQIDTIKADVLRAAPQILQQYGNDIEKEKANFESTLGNARENYADSGLAFSGQRGKGELGLQSTENRNLGDLSQSYGNKLYDLGSGAEQKLGSENFNYDLGALKNYSTDLGGNGGFTLGNSSTPYQSGSYGIGSLQRDEASDLEARRQALLKSASESVVAGRDYTDLFS